jgi:DNA-binding protein H-NS
MDLSEYSLRELKQLKKDVESAIESYNDRQRQQAVAELEAIAREKGFSLAELAGLAKSRKKSAAVPKYAHPQNPELTWSGRGRRPRWLEEALSSGRTLEDLLIRS